MPKTVVEKEVMALNSGNKLRRMWEKTPKKER